MTYDPKYKLFRNYMTNELGITREDIRNWTEEAVKVEVEKLIGQINVAARVEDAVRYAVTKMGQRGTLREDLKDALVREVARLVVDQISVSLPNTVVFTNDPDSTP